LTFGTAGGGGWGDPRARDVSEIERDIAAGLISLEAARRDYGYPLPNPPPHSASKTRVNALMPGEGREGAL
jgi:N-methylhydantoinase B/oxoprolinase/acetone carboxylase alpha subunit